jgi:hypothetical protein
MTGLTLSLMMAGLIAQASTDAKAPGLHFVERFEDADLQKRGFYDGDGKFTLADEAAEGKKSLQYRFETGKILPSDSSGMRRLFEPGDSAYLRYRMKVTPNWKWTNRPYGPHLFLFMTTENDRYHGPASSRLTTYVEPVNGKLRLAAQDIQNKNAPHGLTQGPLRGGYNGMFYDSEDVLFDDGEWHLIEAYFKLNTLNKAADKPNADGIAQAWVDGKLVIDRKDVVYRSTDYPEMKFNQFLLLPYFHHGVPNEQTMWIDDLAVGIERPSEQQ